MGTMVIEPQNGPAIGEAEVEQQDRQCSGDGKRP